METTAKSPKHSKPSDDFPQKPVGVTCSISKMSFSRVSTLSTLLFICLSLSSALADDEEVAASKDCSDCDMCKMKCEAFDDLSEEYGKCVETQAFCCGRRDNCSPFSHRRIPPWGWGLFTLTSSALLALLLFCLCTKRDPHAFTRPPNTKDEEQVDDDDDDPPVRFSLAVDDDEDQDDEDFDEDDDSFSATTLTTMQ